MKGITEIKTIATRVVGRGMLMGKKYSPELLMAAGIVSIIGGTVLACKATTKLEKVIDETETDIYDIEQKYDEEINKYDMPPEIRQDANKQRNHDLMVVRAKGAARIAKLYLPAVSLEVVGIGCMMAAHGIMKKRNVALMAAYKAVEQGFNEYRQRVIEEYGEDIDRHLRFGTQMQEVVTTDEDGKPKIDVVEVADANHHSPYAIFFEEGSRRWSKDPSRNLLFLKAQQQYMNDLLIARGHVFLNEALEALGYDHTKAGSIVGWRLTKDGSTDNFIDFGIYDKQNIRFVNGVENVALLDFNVDGIIYDKL